MSESRTIAVVTGANRGIGLEIARQLSAKGLHVVLTARDKDKADEAAKQLAGPERFVYPHTLDVTNQESVDNFARVLESEFGHVEVLINNAGVLLDKEYQAVNADLDLVQSTLASNLYGPWRMAKALIPLMKKHGGRIINMSSQMGQLATMVGGYPGYRVSKTALNAVTRMLAAELKDSRIVVNAVCPGWVKTDMGGASAPGTVEQGADTAVWLATLTGELPTGKWFQGRKEIPW